MSLMKNAIGILSSLAIQESTVDIPEETDSQLIREMKTYMNQLYTLNEDETAFTVEMVPLKYSKNLNKYLLEVEDLSRFMFTQGYDNVPQAIGAILEHNNLVGQYHKVAVVIDEQEILDEMNQVESLMECIGWDPRQSTTIDHTNRLGVLTNTKTIIEKFIGDWGIPLVKKRYSIGQLHEEVEDVEIKKKPGQEIIHETDPKKQEKKNIIKEDYNEEVDYSQMDGKQLRIQYLKEVAAGLHDDE